MAISNGKADERWLGFLKLALRQPPRIPTRLSAAVEAFEGTDAERKALLAMVRDVEAKLIKNPRLLTNKRVIHKTKN